MITSRIAPIMSPRALRFSGFVKFGVTPDGGGSAGIYFHRLGSNIRDVMFGSSMGDVMFGSNLGHEYDQKDSDRGETIEAFGEYK